MSGWKKTRGRFFDHFSGISIICPQCGKTVGPKPKKAEERQVLEKLMRDEVLWCKDCDIQFNLSSGRNERNIGILFLSLFVLMILVAIILRILRF